MSILKESKEQIKISVTRSATENFHILMLQKSVQEIILLQPAIKLLVCSGQEHNYVYTHSSYDKCT